VCERAVRAARSKFDVLLGKYESPTEQANVVDVLEQGARVNFVNPTTATSVEATA
jgi:hypothetical protein